MGKMHKRLTALLMAAALSFSMVAAGYSVKPEPGTTFTLMTWNVRYGAEGTDAQREQIAFYDADITLLQETDFGVRRSGRVNQAEMYAEGIYDYYLYGKDDDYDTGTIGTSLLTDAEIAERDDYNTLGQIEMHNGYFHADVEVNGVDLSIYNVHLNYLRTDWRAQQLYELALEVDADESEYIIVAGDFNIQSFDELDVLLDKLDSVNNDETYYATYHGLDWPTQAIDNVLYTADTLEINQVLMPVNGRSDHNALYVEFEVK